MSIIIDKYSFDGPYNISTESLEDRAGVYAVLCKKNGKYYPIDVGESATVKTRIKTHDRKNCWEKNCQGTLLVAVYYTPHIQQSGRMAIEQGIRNQYDLPCGKH